MSANLRSSKRHPPQADSGARPSTSDPPKIKLEVENIPPLTLSTAGLERERKAKARLQVLLDDEWVRDVTTTEVVCGGCQRTLKLSKQTLYEASSWKRHRSTCERIAEAEGRPIVKGKSHAKGKGRAQQKVVVKVEEDEFAPLARAPKRQLIAPPAIYSLWYDAAWEDKDMIRVSDQEFPTSCTRAEWHASHGRDREKTAILDTGEAPENHLWRP